MQRMLIVPIALLALASLGCQNVTRLDPTTVGRPMWQRPDDVIAALGIAPGDRVADLGAGDGYFVPFLANAVGYEGMIYAVDVEEEVTEALIMRFAGDGNVEVVRGEYTDPKLPDGTIDLVLLVNTYHHIEDRPGYFARLRGDLSPRGRVAIIEPNQELTGVLSLFLAEGHTSSGPEITREMTAAGYRVANSHALLPVQVFEVFQPSGDDG